MANAELVKTVEEAGIKWVDLEAKVHESLSELLNAARTQVCAHIFVVAK